jgi:hypothetical protein
MCPEHAACRRDGVLIGLAGIRVLPHGPGNAQPAPATLGFALEYNGKLAVHLHKSVAAFLSCHGDLIEVPHVLCVSPSGASLSVVDCSVVTLLRSHLTEVLDASSTKQEQVDALLQQTETRNQAGMLARNPGRFHHTLAGLNNLRILALQCILQRSPARWPSMIRPSVHCRTNPKIGCEDEH